MNMIKRRKAPKMGLRESMRVRSPSHLKWVRGHDCLLAGMFGTECHGKIEAAHVRSSGDGGMGLKPGDQWAVPMCTKHHATQHSIGEAAFERGYHVDLKSIAETLARRSPHLRRR